MIRIGSMGFDLYPFTIKMFYMDYMVEDRFYLTLHSGGMSNVNAECQARRRFKFTKYSEVVNLWFIMLKSILYIVIWQNSWRNIKIIE